MNLQPNKGSDVIADSNSNVLEMEMTWEIENFRDNKNYWKSFVLPQGIECTLGLIPTLDSAPNYFDRHDKKVKFRRFSHIQPILFINKIKEPTNEYLFKFRVKPVGKVNRNLAFTTYQKAVTQKEGYKSKGLFINSENFRDTRGKNGTVTLNLKFWVKKVDDSTSSVECKSLTKDLTKLFMSKNHSDVDILLSGCGCDDMIPAHKFLLSAQSGTFAKFLKEDESIKSIVIKMRYPKQVYIDFLRFIYNNTITNFKDLKAMISLANEYEVDGLKKLCHSEMASLVNIDFGKLTKIPRQVPSHVLMDLDKTCKFSQLLSEMKELFKRSASETLSPSTSVEENSTAVKGIEHVIHRLSKSSVIINPSTEAQKSVNSENTSVVENAELFTESMTNLMTKTLSLDEQEQKQQPAKVNEKEKSANEPVQNNDDEIAQPEKSIQELSADENKAGDATENNEDEKEKGLIECQNPEIGLTIDEIAQPEKSIQEISAGKNKATEEATENNEDEKKKDMTECQNPEIGSTIDEIAQPEKSIQESISGENKVDEDEKEKETTVDEISQSEKSILELNADKNMIKDSAENDNEKKKDSIECQNPEIVSTVDEIAQPEKSIQESNANEIKVTEDLAEDIVIEDVIQEVEIGKDNKEGIVEDVQEIRHEVVAIENKEADNDDKKSAAVIEDKEEGELDDSIEIKKKTDVVPAESADAPEKEEVAAEKDNIKIEIASKTNADSV